MRKVFAAFVAIAALAAPTAALADRGWHGRGGWHRPHRGYSHHHYRHSRPHFAVGYGAPFWWGPPVYGYGYGYDYGPGYGPPLVVRERVIEREPPVYVEREPDAAYEPEAADAPDAAANETDPAGTWYFCRSEDAYYPDAPSCPEAWIPVPARSE